MTGRQDSQVVLKYCEVIDEFIKVRVCGEEEVGSLLDASLVSNRRAYQKAVVERTVIDYEEAVLPLFKKFNRIYKPEALEDVLYQICVEVNPHLEIHQVSLPLTGGAADVERAESLQRRLAPHVYELERDLNERVVGQKQAVLTVSKAIKKAAVGLRDPHKPIGVFLLVGSTGTGKTELAKAIARRLFGGTAAMVRVDCSEFALPHEYAKLIGAPPGYIGHNEGGFLTEAIRNKPASVVLFDEIEKAHHKIHNLLLQLMDEGTLTDGKGNVVRFDQTLVLLTSNLGVRDIEDARNRCGFDVARRGELTHDATRDVIQQAMKSTFSPEFLNRLDDVVVFNALTPEHCRRIARLRLEEVASYLSASEVQVRFAPRLDAFVAELGYSPEYGAREIRRVIRSHVENPLAEALLDRRFGPGDVVSVTVRRGRVLFERGGTARRPPGAALVPAGSGAPASDAS